MNAKWYASTLFIILVSLGLSKGPKKALNQQIVLQFVDLELGADTTHDEVLACIEQQLRSLGIEAIEIVEKGQRQISVRYYSEVDADTVERFLTLENQTATSSQDDNPEDFPKEKEPKKYHLVVSDLYAQFDSDFNAQATLVDHKEKEDVRQKQPLRFGFPFDVTYEINRWSSFDKTLKINSNIQIAFDNFSYQIPEIRAGPSQSIPA